MNKTRHYRPRHTESPEVDVEGDGDGVRGAVDSAAAIPADVKLGGVGALTVGAVGDSKVAASTGAELRDGGARIAGGVGFRMLRSMGWTENTGLGQSRKGIVEPILPTQRLGHLGLGFNPNAAHEAAQEEIRQIQKAKREERDRKLQRKLEKIQAAEEEETFMRDLSAVVPSSSKEHLLYSGSGLLEEFSDPHDSKSPSSRLEKGLKHTEVGQCPHCGQRFDTKHGLKSHMQARHSKLLQAKRLMKERRRQRGHGKQSRKRGSARGLAPLSQNFSVYD